MVIFSFGEILHGTFTCNCVLFNCTGSERSTPGLRLSVLAVVESVAVSAVARSCGCVVGFGWFVVRFVRVIRVPACARVSRVSRVCPGSPRCLFTGYVHTTRTSSRTSATCCGAWHGDHLADEPHLAADHPHLAAARVSGLRRLAGAAHKSRTRGRGIGATCLHLAGTAESE